MATLRSCKRYSQRASGKLEAIGTVMWQACYGPRVGGGLRITMDGEERSFSLDLSPDEIDKLREYINDPKLRAEYFDKPQERE